MRIFLAYVQTSRGLAALLIVASTGLLLGYFIWRSFVSPLPPSYVLDFGGAKWIQPPNRSEETYYRKDVYIAGSVESAWIAIAATGAYQLLVNNTVVDTNQLPGAKPSGLYDVSRLLAPGTNAIAVRVPGAWWTGYPQIRVRGAYQAGGAPSVEFVSDSSWKVAVAGEYIPRGNSWSASLFDDSGWARASESSEHELFSSVQRVTVPPDLIESGPLGNWIRGEDRASAQTNFTYLFNVDSRPVDAWLQVASNGSYDVLINQQLAAVAPTAGQAVLFAGSAPVIFPDRFLAARDLPKLFSPDSGFPGAKSGYAFVRTPPTLEFSVNQMGLRPKIYQRSMSGSLTPQAEMPDRFSLITLSADDLYSGTLSKLPIAAEPFTEAARFPRYLWRSAGPEDFGVTAAQPQFVPLNPAASPLAMPGLSDIAPETAPVTPQIVPGMTSPGPEASAALALTAYSVSALVRAGANSIQVRLRSGQPPAVLLASILVKTADGAEHRFGSDSGWTAFSSAERDQRPAQVAGSYWAAPWGPPVHAAAYELWLPERDVATAAACVLSLAIVTLLVILVWLAAGSLARLGNRLPEASWNSDAIMHLPVALLMLGCLLFTYDVRLAYNWCFQRNLVLGLVLLLAAGKFITLLEHAWPRSGPSAPKPLRLRRMPAVAGVLLLLLLMMIGLVPRLAGMMTTPLGHDEAAMALYAKGIFRFGFPNIIAGSYTRLLSTYELVPYPIALSSLLAPSLPWYRLPSLVFGTLTIGLIGWVGHRLLDWRTGIAAAAVWTFLPVAVNWAGDGFYLSQEGFFALATVWLFYEAIRELPLNPRYLRLATTAFILTYFSWEASGFLIVALFVAIVVLRWGEWNWIGDAHLWRCFAVISAVVILQLCFRQLTLPADYLGFIRDLSELTAPGIVPLDRLVFDPFYYIKTLFLAENHAVLTLLTLSGLIVAMRKPALLYLDIVLVTLYVCYTCLLDHYAPRYCFGWLPMLVLAGCGSFFSLSDRVGRISQFAFDRAVKAACFAGGLLLVVLASNEYVLKLFRAAPDPNNPAYFDRLGVNFKTDYGDADRYVARYLEPGDVVITRAPHVYQFVTGRAADYSIDPRFHDRLLYDGGQNPPGYIDKWAGIRMIRGVDELADVRSRHRRVWLIADVLSDWNVQYFEQMRNYLATNATLVYEATDQRVFLLNGSGPAN